MRFWDSSALVPLFVAQQRTSELRALHGRDPEVLAWVLSDVEIASALHRMEREGAMERSAVDEAFAQLALFLNAAHVIGLSEEVLRRARRLLAVHPLRAADALQLAAALVAVRDAARGLAFVCLDDRLGAAARREGFTLLP
ncbi:MAG TPA: PIN domain-containing protein [Planctomycetes bacterium]|nr:PIN domain-containing protein [Planctomycetota bacterium]